MCDAQMVLEISVSDRRVQQQMQRRGECESEGGGRGAIAGPVVLECNSVDAGAKVLGEAASLLTL